jgi:alginate O-acetyltransferase complex protein AlgI
MLFNSFAFLIFFPIVTATYFSLPHRFRWALLLIASCIFYMAFIPKYILILLVTISVDYFAGIGIEASQGRLKRWLLIASILTNIGMLAFFKYFNFANENLAELAGFIGWNYPIENLQIILPIGLSFHTFQSLSYTIEVYRGRQKAERHYGYLALYVLFYPQLVAGPIERPQNIVHQLHEEHSFDYRRVADGLKWMAWGMFKKVVIADRMALFVNAIYDEPHKYTGPALIVATLAFAIQIYCDFSGYSDIAFGSAQVMGIALMKNFRHPYFAKSISEFWRRWHISLSTWFRDYLYIPLGGNRVSPPRWAFNLMITFLISGLWHGANWTFIIWGALHGFYMVLDRFSAAFWDRVSLVNLHPFFTYLKDTISRLTTFLLVCFAWIFFRANTLQDSWYVISHLFSGWNQFLLQVSEITRLSGTGGWLRLNEVLFQSIGLLTPLSRSEILLTALALILLIYVEVRQEHGNFMEEISLKKPTIRLAYYAILVMTILALGTSYTGVQQAFIYFQF